MKTLLRLAGLLLLVIVAAGVAAVVYVDVLARAAVERGASDALGVPATLRKADVGLLDGTFALSGLEVSNPPGFDDRAFLHLDDGSVAVNLASLREQTVELPALHLTGIDVSLEKRSGASNYQVILDHLKRGESEDAAPSSSSAERTFIVREVLIRDVNVRVDLLPLGGELTTIDIPVPEIRLTDVGTGGDQGVVLRELSGVIVTAVLEAVAGKAGGALPNAIRLDLEQRLAQLTSLRDLGVGMAADFGNGLEEVRSAVSGVNATADELKRTADDVGKNIEGALKDLEKGLGGLLGDPDRDK